MIIMITSTCYRETQKSFWSALRKTGSGTAAADNQSAVKTLLCSEEHYCETAGDFFFIWGFGNNLWWDQYFIYIWAICTSTKPMGRIQLLHFFVYIHLLLQHCESEGLFPPSVSFLLLSVQPVSSNVLWKHNTWACLLENNDPHTVEWYHTPTLPHSVIAKHQPSRVPTNEYKLICSLVSQSITSLFGL